MAGGVVFWWKNMEVVVVVVNLVEGDRLGGKIVLEEG